MLVKSKAFAFHVSRCPLDPSPPLTILLVERVAELMGEKFSAGAIVQHLAKLRQKMAEAELDVPIPPPLKKGVATKEPSKIYATGVKKGKAGNVAKAITRATAESGTATPTPAGRRGTKRKNIKKEQLSDDEDVEDPELWDSDEEYGAAPRKKAKKTKKPAVKKSKALDSELSPKTVKDEEEDQEVKENSGSPSMHTRGVRPNYRVMEGLGEDDEETPESEEDEEKDTGLTTPAEGSPVQDINGLPTPAEEKQEKTSVPATPTRRSAGLPAMQAPDIAYPTPGKPNGGMSGQDIRSYPAMQSAYPSVYEVSYCILLHTSHQLTALQQSQMLPAHYRNTLSKWANHGFGDYGLNNAFGSHNTTPAYPGAYASARNMSSDSNMYGAGSRDGRYNTFMSAPARPAKQNAVMGSYTTPPDTRNNSYSTIGGRDSFDSQAANASQMPTQSTTTASQATHGIFDTSLPSMSMLTDSGAVENDPFFNDAFDLNLFEDDEVA
jgi:hypothetical protein